MYGAVFGKGGPNSNLLYCEQNLELEKKKENSYLNYSILFFQKFTQTTIWPPKLLQKNFRKLNRCARASCSKGGQIHDLGKFFWALKSILFWVKINKQIAVINITRHVEKTFIELEWTCRFVCSDPTYIFRRLPKLQLNLNTKTS